MQDIDEGGSLPPIPDDRRDPAVIRALVPVVEALTRPWFDPVVTGLARRLGTHRWFWTRVWPLFLSVPWGLALGPWMFFVPIPSRIRVEVMAPIRFDRTGDEAAADEAYVRACADRVEAAMQDTLERPSVERAALYAARRRGG